jgi:hypothetical protein
MAIFLVYPGKYLYVNRMAFGIWAKRRFPKMLCVIKYLSSAGLKADGARTSKNGKSELLDFDGCAGFFELGFELVGFFFVDAFLDWLWCFVNECLGFFET